MLSKKSSIYSNLVCVNKFWYRQITIWYYALYYPSNERHSWNNINCTNLSIECNHLYDNQDVVTLSYQTIPLLLHPKNRTADYKHLLVDLVKQRWKQVNKAVHRLPVGLFVVLRFILLLLICMLCACGYPHMCLGKKEEGVKSSGAGVTRQLVVSYFMWVLWTKLKASTKAASALNQWAISPDL